MASTSNRADLAMRESSNTSSSTSGISSSQSSCASCFEWVSSFVPWRSFQSDSNPDYIRENEAMGAFQEIGPSSSTSTTDRIPENENMAAFARILPAASTFNTELIPKRKDRSPFDSLALSASSSASKLMKGPSYQVFINQQGVKSTVATALYGMLTERQLSVFLGGTELEYGDFLPGTLEKVMTSALIHIAIFSERYAESPWCLAELSFMLKTGTTIFPVFYYVDPSDLRLVNQGKGLYAHAFKEHQQKGRYSLERLNEWKDALYQISFYEGEVIRTIDDETRLLNTILNRVLKAINTVPLVVAKYPVGLEEIVRDFERYAFQSSHCEQNVQIIGIWGMGGSGKTTLAKMLYNKRSSSMERSSFVFNIRDAAAEGLLHEKQKIILNDLGRIGVHFDNVDEGINSLSTLMGSVRVFIVLDDVDNVNQLDALLPRKDSLGQGSLVIVTTREYFVLRAWGISSVYKMKALNPLHAKQLFCFHAFLRSYPPEGFEKLVDEFLMVCSGLPLSLKVYGAHLYGEFRKEYWASQLHKISRILPSGIEERLKISYDILDDREKEAFLDIACFFIGEESSLALQVWNGLGWDGPSIWKTLLQKCLVELNNCNIIGMHKNLRNLGRDIAKRQSPYRFWFPQPIIDVKNQKNRRIAIHGIVATSNRMKMHSSEVGEKALPRIWEKNEVDDFRVRCSHGELMIDTNCGIWSVSPALVGLKFLVISGNYFVEMMGEISRELIWLRWFEIRQQSLPSGLLLENLRVLELCEGFDENHLEELWADAEAPMQLRWLFIYGCVKFQGFPKSIGFLNHLIKIIIHRSNITSLPEEFCLLRSLEHLVLLGSRIQSLPFDFGNLSSLEHLDLSRSSELRSLPISFKSLTRLNHLNLLYCSHLTFTRPEDLNCLQNITKLEYLNLYECRQVHELPGHIGNNVSIRELDLRYTGLRELPENIGQLSKLTRMGIGNLWTNLPRSLGGLSSLTNLSVESCQQLEYLPNSLGDLLSLTNLQITDCPKLACLPDSLGDLSSLTNLDIGDCPKLDRLGEKSVAKAIRQLSNLQSLRISKCPISGSSLSFGSSSLRYIYVTETEICRISISELCCTQLERLDIIANGHLEEIEGLPCTLEMIYMENCGTLKKMSSFARLTSLTHFHLRGWNRLEKIEGLQNCMGLKELIVETRMEIPGIESLELLQNLRQLELSANKGPVIERCIQRMQEWPHKTKICALAVPEAVSVLESLVSLSRLAIVDSISNHKFKSSRPKLVQNRSSNGDALMLCFIVNCVSSRMELGMGLGGKTAYSSYGALFGYGKVEKGRWAWIGVFTPRSDYSSAEEFYLDLKDDKRECEEDDTPAAEYQSEYRRGLCAEDDEVEKGLIVRGEEQALFEAMCCLLPRLLRS